MTPTLSGRGCRRLRAPTSAQLPASCRGRNGAAELGFAPPAAAATERGSVSGGASPGLRSEATREGGASSRREPRERSQRRLARNERSGAVQAASKARSLRERSERNFTEVVASAGTGGHYFPEVVPIFRVLGRDDHRRGEQGRH